MRDSRLLSATLAAITQAFSALKAGQDKASALRHSVVA